MGRAKSGGKIEVFFFFLKRGSLCDGGGRKNTGGGVFSCASKSKREGGRVSGFEMSKGGF